MATLAVRKKEFAEKDFEKCLPAKAKSLMKQESKKSLIYFVIALNISSIRKLHANHSERAGKKFHLQLIGKLALRMNSILIKGERGSVFPLWFFLIYLMSCI